MSCMRKKLTELIDLVLYSPRVTDEQTMSNGITAANVSTVYAGISQQLDDVQNVETVSKRNSEDERHLESIRKRARVHYIESADRMKRLYDASHKASIHHFQVGDAVALSIPQSDRSATDMCRLPCRVLDISGNVRMRYKLVCCFGILSGMYMAGDMIPFHGDLCIPHDAEVQVISLREAARKSSVSTRFLRNKCNCLGDCRSRRCSCVNNGIRCSNHCHMAHSCVNVDGENFTELLSVSALTESDIQDLLHGQSLSDNIMCTVSSLLQDYIQGHQHHLGDESSGTPILQILHWSTKQHWITASNIGSRTGVINVYDSKWYDTDTALHNMLASIVKCHANELIINQMHVQRQTNNTDCGLFAIFFAVCIAFGQDPTALRISPAAIRPLLLRQLQDRTLQPLPSTMTHPHRPILRTTSLHLYCVCRMPDDGREMVQCDCCDNWFHASCVGSVDRVREWYCSSCAAA